MTKKKKVISIVSISLLVMVIFGFGFVLVSGAFGFGPDRGHRFSKRDMPLFMQKEISEFVLWRMDKGADTLDLSETQEKLYNGLRSGLQRTLEKGIQTKHEFKKQAHLEFDKETPDLSVIAVNILSTVDVMSSALSENLVFFSNFYNSLDDDQKREITDKIKEKIESRHTRYSCFEREI
ncbi:MAG: hypothetical protein GY699_15400 [Desulfobacteraceae bacterium]|nr:hypothetical protein [Desulfobacteraceae bacterium]